MPREDPNGHSHSHSHHLSPGQGKSRGRIRCDIRSIPHPKSAAAGSWSEVCIENAGRLNSLNTELLQGLCFVFRQLALREDLRCVVVTGAEDVSLSISGSASASTSTPPTSSAPPKPKTPAFCAGADIHEMSALDSSSEASKFITAVHDACQAVRDTPVVTVASIHGLTFGAGLELAASCDFRHASRASLFSMPEVILGIPSVVQARLLANIIGWQRTKMLVYLGHQIDASTAESWGLVDRVFETRGALEEGVWGLVETVAANGPRAMRAQKLLVHKWEESDLRTGVEAGVEAFAGMWRDGGVEPRQYMRPFLERRTVKG